MYRVYKMIGSRRQYVESTWDADDVRLSVQLITNNNDEADNAAANAATLFPGESFEMEFEGITYGVICE